ncbi:hypothetical protein [Virgibacillus sediminis]|uniref:Spore coat protein n=1 Tax=Virgibacillus sediminis TaxID=202260 RepID=A0ABV7A9L9_9BACI
MESGKYGVHEVVDLQELLRFKVVCHAQSKARLQQVEHPELQTIVEQSMKQGNLSISRMKELMETATPELKQS